MHGHIGRFRRNMPGDPEEDLARGGRGGWQEHQLELKLNQCCFVGCSSMEGLPVHMGVSFVEGIPYLGLYRKNMRNRTLFSGSPYNKTHPCTETTTKRITFIT